MKKIRFIVQNQLAKLMNQHVLVFLRPKTIPPDAEFFPLRRCCPSCNGQHGFMYSGQLEVQVGESGPSGSRSPIHSAQPGDVFEARSQRGHGPEIRLVHQNSGGPVEVQNLTSGALRVIWHSGRTPIMEEPQVEKGAISRFDLLDGFLIFRVSPPAPTARFKWEDVEEGSYPYLFDTHETNQVFVSWRDASGGSVLECDPPSFEKDQISEEAPESRPKTSKGGRAKKAAGLPKKAKDAPSTD